MLSRRVVAAFGLTAALACQAAAAQVPSSGPASPPGPSTQESELRALADGLYLEGDLRGAELVFLEIAEIARSSARERASAIVTAAWLQYLRQRHDLATASLGRAFELEPELPIEIGLYDGSFLDLVEAAARKADAKREQRAATILSTARKAWKSGALGEADGLLSELLRQAPSPGYKGAALALLGRVEADDGRTDDAVVTLQAALAVPSLSEETRTAVLASLATALRAVGKIEESSEVWEDLTRHAPRNPQAWRNLGSLRRELGDMAGAVSALRLAYGLSPGTNEVVSALARALIDSGAASEARAILEGAVEKEPDDADLWYAHAQAAAAGGDSAVARRSFLRAVESDPDNARGLAETAAAHLAHLELGAGRLDPALEWTARALGWNNGSVDHWRLRAAALARSGRYDEALAALTTADELEPGNTDLLIEKARVLTSLGRLDEAKSAYETALAVKPQLPAARQGLEGLATHRPATARTVRGAAASPAIAPRKLGVRLFDLDYNRLRLRGALVREVVPRSPAARTGLQKGDLILRLGGAQVLDAKDFFELLKRKPPRQGLEIELLRNATIHTLPLRVR